jgi:hypothetical protein
MNIVLLFLTLVSVLAAIASAWFAWRLRDNERRRSDARVAALSSAIDAVEWPTYAPEQTQDQAVAAGALFAPEHSAAAAGAPVIKLAVGLAMGIVLLVAIAMSNRGAAPGAASDGEAPRPVAARAAAPLELISMRHEREGQTLKVHGLVRNPRSGQTMTRVSAVVFAFNRAGAFVTSGRAGVDFTKLEPGDESPFVVTVPGVADVGRYRVSFRTDTGVVQHVDRRAEQSRLAAFAEDSAGRRGRGQY